MPEWTISATNLDPVPAHRLAAGTHPPLTRPASPRQTFLLTGDDQPRVASCGLAALEAGHRVVLLPATCVATLPSGTLLQLSGRDIHQVTVASEGGTRDGWDVALYSSGSTTGLPRGYGFSTQQLATVTAWYQAIYQVSADSIILTALPSTYNFTFIAGALLAARLGARLHLSQSPRDVLLDAACLAREADRLIVLANPVVLNQASSSGALPDNVLVDSGGAPLSTAAITDFRDQGVDLREGYGLTETASLTHFDADATRSSLGTVGAAMPEVQTTVRADDGKPVIHLASPAIGIPLGSSAPGPGAVLPTTDLGRIDEGRLRLLGRIDDEQIGGLWPRDTLDALGPLLGRRCALISHPTADHAVVRLLTPVIAEHAAALRDRAADVLGLRPEHVTITDQGNRMLLHSVKLSRYSSTDDVNG
jgi:hypothetical protein